MAKTSHQMIITSPFAAALLLSLLRLAPGLHGRNLPPSRRRQANQAGVQMDAALAKDGGWRTSSPTPEIPSLAKETGEELGWLVSPFLNGFYYGYMATRDPNG